jgi:hypothetical protein
MFRIISSALFRGDVIAGFKLHGAAGFGVAHEGLPDYSGAQVFRHQEAAAAYCPP